MRIPILRIALALLTAGCAGGVSRDEVARSRAPGGGVDAVLIETNGGATTSFGYQVHLVPAGQQVRRGSQVASLYAAVRNESAYGANLRWRDANTLAVEYLQARSADVTRSEFRVGGRRVRTILRAGVRDPDAPGGGMLYNRGRSSRRPASTSSGGAAGETAAVAVPVTRDSTWVEVRGPTLVAFWPAHAQAVIDSGGDDATALDDFGYHLSSADSALRAIGVRVVSVEGPRFHLMAGGRATEFVVPRDSADLGYYLIAPGRAPATYYGVLTDSDLVDFTREYLTTRPPSPAEIQ